jgi:hypothetical protein
VSLIELNIDQLLDQSLNDSRAKAEFPEYLTVEFTGEIVAGSHG